MEQILEKIYGAALKFLLPLTTEETYANIVNEAVNLVDGYYGYLAMPENGEFKKVYASSPIAYKSKTRKRANTYKVFKTGKPMIITPQARAHPEIIKLGIRSTIMIPLSYRDKSFGVLVVNAKKDQKFGKKQLNVLKLFGSLASLAVRKTQLYEETKKSLELRDEFILMAGHELRTPLTTIHGYVQLLNLKNQHNTTPESKWIRDLKTETDKLTLLVNDILEVNRIRAGKVQYILKECSYQELLDKAILEFQSQHPNYNLVIENNLSQSTNKVIGDPKKIIQVLVDLLDNAAKFSNPNSEIKISSKPTKSHIITSIKDQGKGINKEDLSKIFEGFYRGANNNLESIGLGLFLAKNILEKHQGSIKIYSKPNKGTTVKIKLPIQK